MHNMHTMQCIELCNNIFFFAQHSGIEKIANKRRKYKQRANEKFRREREKGCGQ